MTTRVPRPADRPDTRIDSLEALRFLAALSVVFYHSIDVIEPGRLDGSLFRAAMHFEIGVDVFFVISGVVMTLTALRAPRLAFGAFMARRFWRIYPLYWLVLLGYFAVEAASAATGIGDFRNYAPRELLSSVLLAPLPWQIVVVAWTLAIEMLFYFIFALGWRLRGLGGALALVGLWYALARRHGDMPFEELASDPLSLALNPIVLEFGFGMAFAAARMRGMRLLDPRLALLAGLGALVWMHGTPKEQLFEIAPREFIWGVPAALIVWGAMGLRFRAPAAVLFGGEISYALYLVHHKILYVSSTALDLAWPGLAGGSDLVLLGVAAACVLTAAALTLGFDRPVRRWRAARARRLPAEDPPAATGALRRP